MSDNAANNDVRKIMEMIPHRYPFLLVDRVLTVDPGVCVEVLKNVTINEPFFQGHFPGLPIMPGVLILEALAQAGGVFICTSSEETFEDKVFVYSGIDKVRFRRPVVPGDQLILRAENMRKKLNLYKMTGTATVNGQVVAKAELMAALVKREDL